MATDHFRGWKIKYDHEKKKWYYVDTKESLDPKNPRPCKKCGRQWPFHGVDPCLGLMDGFKFACCGHGTKDGYAGYGIKAPYIYFNNKGV